MFASGVWHVLRTRISSREVQFLETIRTILTRLKGLLEAPLFNFAIYDKFREYEIESPARYPHSQQHNRSRPKLIKSGKYSQLMISEGDLVYCTDECRGSQPLNFCIGLPDFVNLAIRDHHRLFQA